MAIIEKRQMLRRLIQALMKKKPALHKNFTEIKGFHKARQ
jgi:hypothetical protein